MGLSEKIDLLSAGQTLQNRDIIVVGGCNEICRMCSLYTLICGVKNAGSQKSQKHRCKKIVKHGVENGGGWDWAFPHTILGRWRWGVLQLAVVRSARCALCPSHPHLSLDELDIGGQGDLVNSVPWWNQVTLFPGQGGLPDPQCL